MRRLWTTNTTNTKWLWLLLDVSLPSAGFGAVMTWWSDITMFVQQRWPNEWLLENILQLPNWVPAIVVFLFLLVVTLIVHIARLYHRLNPKLILGRPTAVHTPKGAENPDLVTFKVRVCNKSDENIENCQVRLIEMINKNAVHSAEEGRAFKRSLDSPNDILNISHDLFFNISPEGWEDVDLVQIDYRSPTPTIRMLYALQGVRDTNVIVWIPYNLCPHRIKILASASNCSAPEEKTLELSDCGDGRHLQLEEI